MLIVDGARLLMTPALAFFYGGLVRSKNALNTMMMSFISLGFVGVTWAALGYSLALSAGNDWIGGTVARLPERGRSGADRRIVPITFPHVLFMCFQATFCIITAALISGAIVERMRFSAYLVFITLWSLVVYAPDGALGVGRRLARRRWARWTSPAAPSSTSTPASRRWWRRSASVPGVTTRRRA